MKATSDVRAYLVSRITSLKPSFERPPNVLRVLRSLTVKQWMFFTVGYLAWSWDACDFFSVSLTITELATAFGKSNADITWGLTLVLMFRSVGAIIFGLLGDRYGRKWPFITCNILFIILELGTGFVQTYRQFLAVRALFGICMGGLYGLAAATALEDTPAEARGLLSGIFQQGYAFGYLLATVFARALLPTRYSWRAYFWFCAAPPVLIIIFRLALPENDSFLRGRTVRKSGPDAKNPFASQAKEAFRRYWLTALYLMALMAGMNFMAHGSQDLYPTLLREQYSFSTNDVTVTQVIANLGAMAGATASGKAVSAAAFFEQGCVLGIFGIAPIYLMELAPPAFRTLIVGASYQIGNLISSASPTIEATLGERFPLDSNGNTDRYNYGLVMCLFMAAVYSYIIILTLIGPERKGRDISSTVEDTVEVFDGRECSGMQTAMDPVLEGKGLKNDAV
ncbi:Carboxylic acid transporter protein homolog [Talaromyces islandicus]|uniref:Carboxylic acid transporter protein homolog n=1 Tax=Talaromyces islandicus TaxID=28573 RepID=A0A0U1LPG0_TALIS|nr:Carboxylic acid transporter protein homolog [Talaromyces islandicus]